MNIRSARTSVCVTILVVSLLFVVSCNQRRVNSDKGVVASVGSFEISDIHLANHMKRFYLRTGQAANLNEDFRMAVVNSRIERYAIVEYARDMGWASDLDAIYNLAMIERKVYMEEYQRRFIIDRIRLTDNDLREVFRRYNTTLRASHLHAASYQEADSLYQLLMNGARFEVLAKNVFQTPSLRDTGGDLGYFTIDEMDLAFEDAAYSLQTGQISRPVRTSTGFSIIKLTEIIQTPLITEVQFAQRKPQLEQVARYQSVERATRNDIEAVLSQFEWNTEVVNMVWNRINAQKQAYSTSDVSISELPVSFNESERSLIIAANRGYRFSVQDFISESLYTPVALRIRMNNRQDFEDQLRGLIYRSYALALVKQHPGFDREYVKGSIDETFYGYLFERFEAHVDGMVTVSENEVLETYLRDPSLFDEPMMIEASEIVLTDGELAGKVYELLKNGADFYKMLNEFGTETATKKDHGYLGKLPVTDFGLMSGGLRNVQAGEIRGPFQIASNFFVILKVHSVQEARPRDFSQAASKVRELAIARQRQVVREEIISQLRSRYNARVDVERLNTITFQL